MIYPATIIERFEETRNCLPYTSYKVGFRLYPNDFKEWESYRYIWQDQELETDNNNKIFIGDKENIDEIIPFYSSRIQKLGTNEGKNNDDCDEKYCIDDLIVYDLKEKDDLLISNKSQNEEDCNSLSKMNINDNCYPNFLEKVKTKLNSMKKTYVIPKSQSYSLYYSLLISEFANNDSYQKMINLLYKDNPEKPNPELIHYIFLFFGYSSTLFHKEFLKELSNDMKENVINYLNDLSEKDLRNIKKETIEIIQKVLQYYLNFSIPAKERNEIIENFSLSFSLKMLKSSLLEKRISAVNNIVDIIKNSKNNKEKIIKLLEIFEKNKIFNEIFGSNSHIQLINRSKNLLEIMLSEDKLSNKEMGLIWEATKKGDLEGKLTILKLLKEISLYLKEKHIKMLIESIYLTDSEHLIKEEIDLIYDLATHYTQPQEEIKRIIDYFLKGLFSGNFEDEDDKKMKIIINKIIDTIRNQYNHVNKKNIILEYVVNILFGYVRNKMIKYSYISLRILKILIREFPIIYKNDNTNEEKENEINDKGLSEPSKIYLLDNNCEPIIDLKDFSNYLIENFEEFRNLVKETIKNKNWNKDIDLLNVDNQTYTENLKIRLSIISLMVIKKIWKNDQDPILLVFKILIQNSICEKDNFIFYEWIQYLLNSEKLSFENETKIFNLFNETICADNKKCQNLSIHAFESYLKIFLDINKRNNLLDFYMENVN